MISYLSPQKEVRIAYHKTEGTGPGIIFLGGFRSDMSGVKATALENHCRKRGIGFIRFDYEGHGESSGVFEEGTIGQWYQNALEVLVKLTKGKQILVGSSMGAWIALLLARKKPARIAGIVGIAAAPDFTEYMMLEKLTDAQLHTLNTIGKIMVDSDYGEQYAITKSLLEEARNHLVLHEKIPVKCPVRLLHGMEDQDVPWEFSLTLNRQLESRDVKTILIKGGDHRLSEPDQLQKIISTVEKMREIIGK